MELATRLFPPTAFDLARPEDWIALVARVGVGLMFFLSGAYKLFTAQHAEKMCKAMVEAGVGAPRQTARFVSGCEFGFGAFLVIGFLTPLAALVLLIICVVALITVTGKTVESASFGYRLSSYLDLPETLLIFLTAWIAVYGPTGASLDALLFRR